MRTEGMKTGRLQLILCPQFTQSLDTDSTVLGRPLLPSFGKHTLKHLCYINRRDCYVNFFFFLYQRNFSNWDFRVVSPSSVPLTHSSFCHSHSLFHRGFILCNLMLLFIKLINNAGNVPRTMITLCSLGGFTSNSAFERYHLYSIIAV